MCIQRDRETSRRDDFVLYFAKQRQVAIKYTQYSRRKYIAQSTKVFAMGILHMACAKALLTADCIEIVGERWKEFVKHCRLQILPFPTKFATIDQDTCSNWTNPADQYGDGGQGRGETPRLLNTGALASRLGGGCNAILYQRQTACFYHSAKIAVCGLRICQIQKQKRRWHRRGKFAECALQQF